MSPSVRRMCPPSGAGPGRPASPRSRNDDHDDTLAEDIVQEAFVRAWRHTDALRDGPGSR
ncbi:sigma factor [Streptomyces sp. NPDC046870]|uniref:sigma factor n=1 Tax=Streptomyces sp. NPDC046870 TaxID=3155135 RepID=UPI0034525615